jgi:RNA polymerase sigma-70 factor (ECF subfamily)
MLYSRTEIPDSYHRCNRKITICFLPCLCFDVLNTEKKIILIEINLIEECRGGNFNNFRKLVEVTSPFAYSVAFRMLGDKDQAKDVVQETMVAVWQQLRKIKSASVYKTWVYKIVINKCYDNLRKRKRNREYSATENTWALLSDTVSQWPSSELEDKETAMIISILTNRLSPKQKAVFVLSELEEMTSDEISGITGMSKQTVKSNLYYARKSISEMLEKYL